MLISYINDFINTMIEMTSVFFLYYTISSEHFARKNVLRFLCICILLSLLFASFDNPIFIVNFSLILMAQVVSFSPSDPKEGALYGTTTGVIISILEPMTYSLMPPHWLQGDLCNYISNTFILALIFSLYKLSGRYQIGKLLKPILFHHPVIILVSLALITFFVQAYLSRLSVIWTYLPGVLTLLIFLLILAVIAIYIRYIRSADRLRADMLEKNMANLDEFLLTLRIQNHDYKHHIHHIQNQIQTATDLPSLREEVHAYVQQIETDRSFISSLQSIQQPLFRSILFGAYQRCAKQHIPFRLDCTSMLPSFPLKDYQLVEVLENLMTNAIEQNMTLPQENRFLTVALSADGSANRCAITNPIAPDFNPTQDLFKPGHSSKGSAHQGLGLASAKQILDGYSIPLSQKQDFDRHTITFSFSYQIEGKVA